MDNHGGMILTGETKEFKEKPPPVPLRPPQMSQGLTQVSTMKCRQLTASAKAQLSY
jgi:hypothetical protein